MSSLRPTPTPTPTPRRVSPHTQPRAHLTHRPPRAPPLPPTPQCVGLATAAFALELVRGRVRPGVWYPAELEAPVRASILAAAREDSFVYEVNGPHPV